MQAIGISKSDTSRVYALVKKAANSLIDDIQEREDMVQDIMVKVLSSKAFPDVFPAAYLWSTVRHATRDRFRKEARRINCEPVNLTNSFNDEEVIIFKEHVFPDPFIADAITKAFRELKPEQRNTFNLYTAGFEYGEIAVMVNVPINTVRSRIHYTKHRLQESLACHR